MADRARYKLGIWEVQLRDTAPIGAIPIGEDVPDIEDVDKEVWVRRKQRIG